MFFIERVLLLGKRESTPTVCGFLRRGSTKGLGHFSPVAVPANRRLSRKTARELPVCPKNGKAVFPKNMRSQNFDRCHSSKQALVPQNRSGTSCLPEKPQSRFSNIYVPPPAARRRAPPPPPLVSRVSRPETQLTCIRARLEY